MRKSSYQTKEKNDQAMEACTPPKGPVERLELCARKRLRPSGAESAPTGEDSLDEALDALGRLAHSEINYSPAPAGDQASLTRSIEAAILEKVDGRIYFRPGDGEVITAFFAARHLWTTRDGDPRGLFDKPVYLYRSPETLEFVLDFAATSSDIRKQILSIAFLVSPPTAVAEMAAAGLPEEEIDKYVTVERRILGDSEASTAAWRHAAGCLGADARWRPGLVRVVRTATAPVQARVIALDVLVSGIIATQDRDAHPTLVMWATQTIAELLGPQCEDTPDALRTAAVAASERLARIKPALGLEREIRDEIRSALSQLLDGRQSPDIVQTAHRILRDMDDVDGPRGPDDSAVMDAATAYCQACAALLQHLETAMAQATDTLALQDLGKQRSGILDALGEAHRLDLLLPHRFRYDPDPGWRKYPAGCLDGRALDGWWEKRLEVPDGEGRAEPTPEIRAATEALAFAPGQPAADLLNRFADPDSTEFQLIGAAHRLLADSRDHAGDLLTRISVNSPPEAFLAARAALGNLAFHYHDASDFPQEVHERAGATRPGCERVRLVGPVPQLTDPRTHPPGRMSTYLHPKMSWVPTRNQTMCGSPRASSGP